MMIGRHRRPQLVVCKESELAVSFERQSISSSGICPEVEKEARAVLEGTAEVAMLAQIDLRIEDSGKDPGVLEEVVLGRRLGGGVGQGPFRGEPRDELIGIDDSGCGKAGTQPYGGLS